MKRHLRSYVIVSARIIKNHGPNRFQSRAFRKLAAGSSTLAGLIHVVVSPITMIDWIMRLNYTASIQLYCIRPIELLRTGQMLPPLVALGVASTNSTSTISIDISATFNAI